MAKKRVGHITISRRVVQIGHEAYPLANISRVQTLRIRWAGKLATLHPIQQILPLIILIVAAVMIPPRLPSEVDPDTARIAREAADIVIVAGSAGVVILLTLLLYRLFFRRIRYALMIETAGTQYTALMGADLNEIQRIKGIIVDAIEDPPFEAIHVDVRGDVVMGDKADQQYKQTGSGNRMFS
ncbi:DUF6232 family protein [Streptomyces sp. NPDC058964]|uniref:DUF6232 family protein n=1 Tax=Streptomyces sp. NPDC058964 TaxID=3346681 RepID=UPI0036BB0C71